MTTTDNTELLRAVHETSEHSETRQAYVATLDDEDRAEFYRLVLKRVDEDIAFFTAELHKGRDSNVDGWRFGTVLERQRKCREKIETLHALRQELEAERPVFPYDWPYTWERLCAVVEELVKRGVIPKSRRWVNASRLFTYHGKPFSNRDISRRRDNILELSALLPEDEKVVEKLTRLKVPGNTL